MLCRYCNGDNDEANAYCEKCGKQLGLVCVACGHLNRPNSQFCGSCSAALGAALPSFRPGASEMLRALSVSGGERKQLTVSFADISNSTSLIDQVDPEDAVRRVQPVIDAMRHAVEAYDGIVNKVQGDGVMALFGAPIAHEDHAVRACAAALAIQASVSKLGDPDMKVRVGLNTGEVVVQAVINSLYQTYDVAGAAAHLAARMEQMAEPGDILLTADTVAAARQLIEVVSLGLHAVRGRAEFMEIFRLLRLRHAPASVIFRSQPQLSPLIGRTAQLEALKAEFTSAGVGEARVVGVAGEAGSGKSRLCFEFAEFCRARDVVVYEARVTAHGHATPYQPILELLRDYLGIRSIASADQARPQVEAAISKLAIGHDVLPLLLGFLGLADPGQPTPKLDPAVRRARLIELVRRIVCAGVREGPVVILIEDLHWIDAASEEFVGAIVEGVVGTKTMLLFNFRHGYAAPWTQLGHYREVSLPPLDRPDAEALLSNMLGRDSSLALILRNIAERAQGNPFFLEELVHALVDRGDFEGERGAYRLTGGIDRIPLPATVEALLAVRIDHLDEAARQVLQYAAVIGREVPFTILQSVTGLPQAGLSEALLKLRRAELLRELPLDPGLHAFSHPLIQEVCYRALLRERRRTIHNDVARLIKQQFASGHEERAALLAYHLEEAGASMEAAQANMRAAMWIGAHDASQALRTWKKAHELLSTQPDSEAVNFLRMQACVQIMGFGWREGMLAEEAQRWFEEARRLALAGGNMRANAWIHALYGRNLAVRGSADDYVARTREAIDLAAKADDRSIEATLMAVLCQALRLAGRLEQALAANIEALDRVHEISEFDRQLFNFDVEYWLTVMRGQTLVLLGRFDEARPHLDRMLRTNIDPDDITLHLVSVAYADLAWGEGDLGLADFHAERAMKMAVDTASPYVRVNALVCRGLSDVISHRYGAAVDEFEKALTAARFRKAGLEGESTILAHLANAYRLYGDIDSALRMAAEAIEVATARASRVAECLARIVHADMLFRSAGTERARQELEKASALMKETGARLYEPLIREISDRIQTSHDSGHLERYCR